MTENIFKLLKFDNSAAVQYSRGHVIFSQNSTAKGVLHIIEGSVRLVRHAVTGHTVTIQTATKNESIAEASLFSETYHCDCIAIEDCLVQFFDKATILNSLRSNPELCLTFMSHFAEQTIKYRRRVELLTMKGAKEKVFTVLADGLYFDTILQLASYVGLTHEATYRALLELTKSGLIIKIERGKYKVSKLTSD